MCTNTDSWSLVELTKGHGEGSPEGLKRGGGGTQPHAWRRLIIEYHKGGNAFTIVSGIPVPSHTVMKWDVPSGEYPLLVFLHRDRCFGTTVKKGIIP